MKLVNDTDIPIDKIMEIRNFVRPNNLPTSKYDIHICYRIEGNTSGRFRETNGHGEYTGDEDEDDTPVFFDPSRRRPRIIVRTPYRENGFPYFEKYRVWKRLIHLDFHKQDEKTGEIYPSYRTCIGKKCLHAIVYSIY